MEWLSTIFSLLISIIQSWFRHTFYRKRQLKSLYEVIWKKSSNLIPEDVIGIRPYNEYYHLREQDEAIFHSIGKSNILITGPSLAGKSRAVFQALTKSGKDFCVLKPRCKDVLIEHFFIPKSPRNKSKLIVFIDDLHRFVEQQNFEYLIVQFLKPPFTVIATCRSGVEYKKAISAIASKNLSIESIFDTIIEINRVSEEIGKDIAKQIGRDWDKDRFDGTIGSIVMPLTEMGKRFNDCSIIEKTVLIAIKKLYQCGIYIDKQSFNIEWIKIAVENDDLSLKRYKWTECFEKLQDYEFIKLSSNSIQIEEVYLETVIKYPNTKSTIEIMKEMIEIFSRNSSVLFNIAATSSNAYIAATSTSEKVSYLKTAIKSYELIYNDNSIDIINYIATLNNLGNAYRRLSELENNNLNLNKSIEIYIEALKKMPAISSPWVYASLNANLAIGLLSQAGNINKKENCMQAIKYINNVLNVKPIKAIPDTHGNILNILGKAYIHLAEDSDRQANLRKALETFKKALTVVTADDNQDVYSLIQHNIGYVYTELNGDNHKQNNLQISVQAFKEALKYRTIDKCPFDYATTLYCLGIAHKMIAEDLIRRDDVSKHKCSFLGSIEQAINSFKEAQRVHTYSGYPEYYADNQLSLAQTYQIMAEGITTMEEDKNYYKLMDTYDNAIEAYREALKIFDPHKHPLNHANIQFDLGNIYRLYATKGDIRDNCKRSIQAYTVALTSYEAALNYLSIEEHPLEYSKTNYGLGNAHIILSNIEKKKDHLKKAENSFEKALNSNLNTDIFCAEVKLNLGLVLVQLAKIENKEHNCKRAIKYIEDALKIYKISTNSVQYSISQLRLGDAYMILAEVDAVSHNYIQAIKAYNEALLYYKRHTYPEKYGKIHYGIGWAYFVMGYKMGLKQNYDLAFKHFSEALDVIEKKEAPESYPLKKDHLKKMISGALMYKETE